MGDYFELAKIDNPLNIKRVMGDLPTTKSSPKNVLIIIGLSLSMAFTLNKVWAFALHYIKSPVFTGIIMGVVYLAIILKVASVTVFEEKKHRKAYRDLLDNRLSDLSVIWEIQNIKEEEILGDNIVYIDYINGSRTVLLKCVPGSILNLDPDTPKYHYSSIERALKYIDDLGYTWNIHVEEESANEELALNFYYDKLKNYDDEDFISIFTEQLDTIAHVSEIRSTIHVTYIEITGTGKYKHNMIKNLSTLPEVMGTNTIFKSIELISKKAEVDAWIANLNSVSMFDRDDLIMNKYRETFNLGVTTVLAAFEHTGELIRQFNNDLDIKKLIRKESTDINRTKNIPHIDKNKNLVRKEIPEVAVNERPRENGLGERKIIKNTRLSKQELQGLAESKDKTYLELLYAKDKVELGKK